MRMILKTAFHESICLENDEIKELAASTSVRSVFLSILPEPGSDNVIVVFADNRSESVPGYLSDRNGSYWITIIENKLSNYYNSVCEIYVNRVDPYEDELFRIRLTDVKISSSVRKTRNIPAKISGGRIVLSRDFSNEYIPVRHKYLKLEFSPAIRKAVISMTDFKAKHVAMSAEDVFIYTFKLSKHCNTLRTGGSINNIEYIKKLTGFDLNGLVYNKTVKDPESGKWLHLLDGDK